MKIFQKLKQKLTSKKTQKNKGELTPKKQTKTSQDSNIKYQVEDEIIATLINEQTETMELCQTPQHYFYTQVLKVFQEIFNSVHYAGEYNNFLQNLSIEQQNQDKQTVNQDAIELMDSIYKNKLFNNEITTLWFTKKLHQEIFEKHILQKLVKSGLSQERINLFKQNLLSHEIELLIEFAQKLQQCQKLVEYSQRLKSTLNSEYLKEISEFVSDIYKLMLLTQLDEEENLKLSKLILCGFHNYQLNYAKLISFHWNLNDVINSYQNEGSMFFLVDKSLNLASIDNKFIQNDMELNGNILKQFSLEQVIDLIQPYDNKKS